MLKLVVKKRENEQILLDAQEGLSFMEIIRDGGVDELLALCGGCCSCATCHIYVDADFVQRLPAMSDDENDLLGGSDHRTERSRLSCQIAFSAALDGVRVTIAPED